MLGIEVNSVVYPVDQPKPARDQTFPPAPRTAKDARRRGAPQLKAGANGERGPVRTGIKARTAVLVAVGASIVGVLLGRRSAGSG